jgi:hypothetical protein
MRCLIREDGDSDDDWNVGGFFCLLGGGGLSARGRSREIDGDRWRSMEIEGKSGNDVMEAASGRLKGESGRHGADTEVVRSTQMREVSERKVYFDFEGLESGSMGARFLRAYPGIREVPFERRKLGKEVTVLRSQGLGWKHPDVLSVREKMKPMEEEVLRSWKGYQSRRVGRRSERMSRVRR